MVVMTWEDRDGFELAVMYLRMMGCNESEQYHLGGGAQAASLSTEVASFFERHDVFPRFDHLMGILAEKRDTSQQQRLKGIVFVQQKTTAHILSHFINTDSDISGLRAVPLHSVTTAPPTPSLSLSPAAAKTNMEAFASGEAGVNVLVTTVVAEEGVDIASANCVIRFDPVLTGVSFVQGRGRARQADSSFVIMSQKAGASVEMLMEAEQVQRRLVSSFNPQMTKPSEEDLRRDRVAQASRERGAKQLVIAAASSRREGGMQALHLFCVKTKVALREHAKAKQGGTDSGFRCTLVYKSVLREASGAGSGKTKKEAKKLAGHELLLALAAQLQA